MAYSNESFDLVVAIDFGTTYSGYAFGRKGDLRHIHLNKEWGNKMGLPSLKTATTVLTGTDGQLEAFGFDAEYKYSQLLARDDAQGLDLYRNFKMLLHNQKEISREAEIVSSRGTKRLAIEIFTMALQYLRDHFLEAITVQDGRVPEDFEIKWVVTIPAIWSDKSKQFMREAAFGAKLIPEVNSRQLQFALEPEVAALYCQALQMDQFIGSPGQVTDVKFDVGTKYLIIDAGGGTVDITAQEIQPDGQVKELVAASGGGWGGNRVNIQFEEMMNKVFGQEFIETYKHKCPDGWFELEVSFEKKKRATQPDGESVISLPITRSLEKQFNTITGNDIEEAIHKYKELGILVRNDALVFDPTAIFELFHDNFRYIIPHVTDLLKSPKLQGLKYIFLVGGFADSVFLQKAVSSAFLPPDYIVLTPDGSGTAVLKGAVIFGHKPEIVHSRIARKTYGHAILKPFSQTIHDPRNKMFNKDNEPYCCNIFDKHVTIGERVEVGEVRTLYAEPFDDDATDVVIELYSTDINNPMYVNEPEVENLGELILDLEGIPRDGEDLQIEIEVKFGGPEMYVEAKDTRKGGKSVKTTLDFLSN